MITTFRSVEAEHHIKKKIGACRFYGSTTTIINEEEAKAFIEKVKEEFVNATHYVYAYKIGIGNDVLERYSDDGEPANSSGPPILQSIIARDLTNIIVVVTRYYGGVNQGIGGLIRAYGSTASEVLDHAKIAEYLLYQEFKVKPVEYSELGDIIHFVESFRGNIIDIEYGANVVVKAALGNNMIDKFKIKMRDITKGQGKLVLGDFVWKRKK